MKIVYFWKISLGEDNFCKRFIKYVENLENVNFRLPASLIIKKMKIIRKIYLSKILHVSHSKRRSLIINHIKFLKHCGLGSCDETIRHNIISLLRFQKSYTLEFPNYKNLLLFRNFKKITDLNIKIKENKERSVGTSEKAKSLFLRIASHISALNSLRELSIKCYTNQTSQNLLKIFNQIPVLFEKNVEIHLKIINNSEKEISLMKPSNYILFSYLTKLEISDSYDFNLLEYFFQDIILLKKLTELKAESSALKNKKVYYLKSLKKLERLKNLSLQIEVYNKNVWTNFFDVVKFPPCLIALNLSLYGELDLDSKFEYTIDWKKLPPNGKLKHFDLFLDECQNTLGNLSSLTFRLEIKEFKSKHIYLIICILLASKKLKELNLAIDSPEQDKLFYDKYTINDKRELIDIEYFFLALPWLEKNLCKLNLSGNSVDFSNLKRNIEFLELSEFSATCGMKAVGLNHFFGDCKNIQNLDLNWIAINSEKTFDELISTILAMEILKKLDISICISRVKKERVFEGLQSLLFKSKANFIFLKFFDHKFIKKQLQILDKSCFERELKKDIRIEFESGNFLYNNGFSSFMLK